MLVCAKSFLEFLILRPELYYSDVAKEIKSMINKRECECFKMKLNWFKIQRDYILFLSPLWSSCAGPRELCSAVNLISQYKLLKHHEFFWKKSFNVSQSDSHCLYNVVGDTEIRKGDVMHLYELIQNMS